MKIARVAVLFITLFMLTACGQHTAEHPDAGSIGQSAGDGGGTDVIYEANGSAGTDNRTMHVAVMSADNTDSTCEISLNVNTVGREYSYDIGTVKKENLEYIDVFLADLDGDGWDEVICNIAPDNESEAYVFGVKGGI